MSVDMFFVFRLKSNLYIVACSMPHASFSRLTAASHYVCLPEPNSFVVVRTLVHTNFTVYCFDRYNLNILIYTVYA